VVTRLGGDLHDLVADEERVAEDRTRLLFAIDQERRALVAPTLSAFERLQNQIGRLEQRAESLKRLEALNALVATLDEERRRVAAELDRVQREALAIDSDRAKVLDRCRLTAEQMNAFQAQLPQHAQIGGLVDVDPQDLTFYVGRGRWDQTLGEERRVVFFLSYHYALFTMNAARGTPFPNLAMLDNPFQQDVPESHVLSALRILNSTVTALGQQVLIATRRELPGIEGHRIRLTHQFNPGPSGARGA
jgi:hypothetical protein